MAAEHLNVADACADDLDRLIRSALRRQVDGVQPSPRAWARIVSRIERERSRPAGRPDYAIRPERLQTPPPDARQGGLLLYWLRWTQLSHQVR
jgi:hypothetical protein